MYLFIYLQSINVLWLVSDGLCLLLPQVSWWRWSICAWTDTISGSHRRRAAPRPSGPPASPRTPQAPQTLRPVCSTTAWPALRASHETPTGIRFSSCAPSRHCSVSLLLLLLLLHCFVTGKISVRHGRAFFSLTQDLYKRNFWLV